MKEIQDFEGLQALRLEGNTVGVEAAQAIAKALETKSALMVRRFSLFIIANISAVLYFSTINTN